MSTLRAAAQQALEALENALDAQSNPMRQDFPTIHDFGQMRRAHTDLRAALAQQEQAEPVAWMYQWKNGTDRTRHVSTAKWPESNGWAEWPLYTAPLRREWRSLSEEEIDAVMPYCHNKFELHEYMEVARATEAALRSKNYG